MSTTNIKRPSRTDSMVVEKCPDKDNCLDLLCVDCGWEGNCEPKDAAWPIFQTHNCVSS